MINLDEDAAVLTITDDRGKRLLNLRIRPDSTLDAEYDDADVTDAARVFLAQLRRQWAQAAPVNMDFYPASGRLRRLFTETADAWWHGRAGEIQPAPSAHLDTVDLGHRLAGLFPDVRTDYLGTPVGQGTPRWHSRLVCFTGMVPCAPPRPRTST